MDDDSADDPLDGPRDGPIDGEAQEDAGPARRISTLSSRDAVTVEVGTSALCTGTFATQVSQMVNEAYGYGRLSPGEVRQRLGMGDAGENANRVLHVAWRGDALVGCCSSTKQVPWCPTGCGHVCVATAATQTAMPWRAHALRKCALGCPPPQWGLLVVAVEAQGTGVASALVAAAEERLMEAGLGSCQIEYEYTCGDAQSERLYKWYEGTLGFHGGGAPTKTRGRCEWRRCRKRLERRSSRGPRSEHSPAASRRSSAASGDTAMVRSSSRTGSCWARMLRALFG